MKKLLFPFACICLVLSWSLSSCSKKKPPISLPPPHVDAIQVKAQDVPYIIDYPAIVSGVVDFPVIARVSGTLFKQLYIEGTYVKKGQALYQIDPRPFENQLKADAGQLIKDSAARDEYKSILDRYQNLYKINAVSKQDVETATISYKAALGQVQTDLGMIANDKLNIQYCLVEAPVDGLIAERVVTIGQMVSAYQTVLNYINSKSNLYINFSVPESDRLKLQSGIADGMIIAPSNYKFRINLQLSDGGILRDIGMVNFFDTRISLLNGAWSMRADVDNTVIKRNKLLSGQFVHIYLIGAKFKNAIAIPQVAVAYDNQGPFVYTLNKDNIVERRTVTPGVMNGTIWVINSGLNNGDKVVINGNMKVISGSKIIVDSLVSQNISKFPS